MSITRRYPTTLPLLLALAALACGPNDVDPPLDGDEPPGDVDGAPAPATDPAAADPGVDLPTLLERNAERAPDGRLLVLDEMLPPLSADTQAVENRHDPSSTDTVRTLHYGGLDVEILEVSSSGKQIMRSLRVTDARWTTADGLAVGASREQVRRLRGEPERSEDGEWIYEIGDGPAAAPTTLRVGFDGDTVASLTWEFYVD